MLGISGWESSNKAMSLSSSLFHLARGTPLGGGTWARRVRPLRVLSTTDSLYCSGCARLKCWPFPRAVGKALPHTGQVVGSDSICPGINRSCSGQIRFEYGLARSEDRAGDLESVGVSPKSRGGPRSVDRSGARPSCDHSGRWLAGVGKYLGLTKYLTGGPP